MDEIYKRHCIQAGAFAKEALLFGKSLIQKGASYNNIIQMVHEKILQLGAKPAFPPQIALDHVAAHFLTNPGEDIILSHQIVKLDVGVAFHGAIGDCATTVDLSGTHQKLIDAAEACLSSALSEIRVGQKIRNLGSIIEKTAASFGYSSVKNLSGHGLASYKIHTPPSFPNYDDGSQGVIKPGMTFAIEPFVTTGQGIVVESGEATIFSMIGKPKGIIREPLIDKIKSFKGLPFAIHDLVDASNPASSVKQSIQRLLRDKIIEGYPPLVERTRGLVAQAEHSVLVDLKGVVFITTR